ncbi:MAG: N-acetyl-gamma-glutamyl-phosphate reductase [Gammaproteobacteria bacterium]|nr:N-acetyl-gamma-glutamyl-phosphate reductase [Gammaproteobacteria bacterium]MCY4218785.1 N-acetyl-gamma-glutamyl-phosphate reductase [Gammaproteobacteria bacterium]MCY4274718.1 N-acetyl-gamma-glutamyl-phosphate reductase [Gammaproteobacteria bacterium]
MIQVGIIGGTGYTGLELLRLLASHPEVEVTNITSREQAGNSVCDLFPSLEGHYNLKFEVPEIANLGQCDIVFSAAPNGVAMNFAPQLIDMGVRFIDLSADFRLRDAKVWEHWYGMTHACPELLDQAVYGLTEIHRDQLPTAKLVANPGCYPTVVQLGFLPLLEGGHVEAGSLIADVKSGVSGAGRKADLALSFSETSDSLRAYGVSGHRHLPEILQGLALFTTEKINMVFTPHLIPMNRGIHATLYAKLNNKNQKNSAEDFTKIYTERYDHEPFIRVMPTGSHPDVRSVRGSNNCRIALHRPQDGRIITILVVEDNLVKGAAGQAIQNMNVMVGCNETTGLSNLALVP